MTTMHIMLTGLTWIMKIFEIIMDDAMVVKLIVGYQAFAYVSLLAYGRCPKLHKLHEPCQPKVLSHILALLCQSHTNKLLGNTIFSATKTKLA